MLSGLRSVAGVLVAERETKSLRYPPAKPSQKETSSSFFVKQNNPGYYKDNNGIIRTPIGKPLFSVSEKYNIGLDGTIFEYDKPVGILKMYDVAASIIAAEDALALRLSPPFRALKIPAVFPYAEK
ncbi:MAG: hypothetical protein LBD73_06620 [Deferribacteraceae bacterium]|jgi:hypothetical protein|nr:hypothetical protein [Deferribacteraceae bacterium]